MSSYIIKKMVTFHCKRGPPGCERCRKLAEEGEKWCVLELFPGGSDPPVARPVVEVSLGEESSYYSEFEFVQCFATREEAESKLQELS